jgi:predicted nucleic acid-binding protein
MKLPNGELKKTVAEYYNLDIVSFDSDFDRTEKGRKEPKDLIK